ncbi:unnamed protein product [Effrenium voratum]|nr:unnamed protein product [Effrenium voratum]
MELVARPAVQLAPQPAHCHGPAQQGFPALSALTWGAAPVGAAVAAQVWQRTHRGRGKFRGACRATAITTPPQATEIVDVKDQNVQAKQPCACPLCFKPFDNVAESGAVCQSCGVGFPRVGAFLDLTISSARAPEELTRIEATIESDEPGFLQQLPFVDFTDSVAERLGLPQSRDVEKLGRELIQEPQRVLSGRLQPAGTSTFQNPLVSFAYERGWRRSFASSGFPGPDEEFRLAQDFLKEGTGLLGDTLLDASCGSGLFSRRFVSSGDYATVVALDFSESMLRQVDDFAKKDFGANYDSPAAPSQTALKLVRGDIARLPFASNSLGGVHAGAAIHCWPNPENAVAEVARVLRPGGVFVLSTFMPKGPLAAMGTNNTPYRFWTEEELLSLTKRCGLVNFEAITKDPAFIMVRVKKPLKVAKESDL